MPGIVNWGILPSNPRTQRITVGYATQADLANQDTLAANRVMPITPVEDLLARYVIWDNFRLDLVAQKIDPATGSWPTRKLNFSEGAYICETYGEQRSEERRVGEERR